MPTIAELDQLDGETTDIISSRIKTVAFGTIAVAWGVLVGDHPQAKLSVSNVHLVGSMVLALFSIVTDYFQYFFKYRAIYVLRQRLGTSTNQEGMVIEDETVLASCGNTELKLSCKKGTLSVVGESKVDRDPELLSYRLVHSAFWFKQIFAILSVSWLIVALGVGILG